VHEVAEQGNPRVRINTGSHVRVFGNCENSDAAEHANSEALFTHDLDLFRP
jgi:hypothetical protein